MAAKTPARPDRPAAFQPRLSVTRPAWRTAQNEHDSSIGSPPGSLNLKIQRRPRGVNRPGQSLLSAGSLEVRGIPASQAADAVLTTSGRTKRYELPAP